MKFLATLFFIVLFFYLLSLVGRVLLRSWAVKKTREFQQRRQPGQGTRKRREGEITIETSRYEERKKIRSDAGNYVDYEEIKD